jgi:hypothetical protein
VPENTLDGFPPTRDLLGRLQPSQLLSTLWFSTMLVEEADRAEVENLQQYVVEVDPDMEVLDFRG